MTPSTHEKMKVRHRLKIAVVSNDVTVCSVLGRG